MGDNPNRNLAQAPIVCIGDPDIQDMMTRMAPGSKKNAGFVYPNGGLPEAHHIYEGDLVFRRKNSDSFDLLVISSFAGVSFFGCRTTEDLEAQWELVGVAQVNWNGEGILRPQNGSNSDQGSKMGISIIVSGDAFTRPNTREHIPAGKYIEWYLPSIHGMAGSLGIPSTGSINSRPSRIYPGIRQWTPDRFQSEIITSYHIATAPKSHGGIEELRIPSILESDTLRGLSCREAAALNLKSYIMLMVYMGLSVLVRRGIVSVNGSNGRSGSNTVTRLPTFNDLSELLAYFVLYFEKILTDGTNMLDSPAVSPEKFKVTTLKLYRVLRAILTSISALDDENYFNSGTIDAAIYTIGLIIGAIARDTIQKKYTKEGWDDARQDIGGIIGWNTAIRRIKNAGDGLDPDVIERRFNAILDKFIKNYLSGGTSSGTPNAISGMEKKFETVLMTRETVADTLTLARIFGLVNSELPSSQITQLQNDIMHQIYASGSNESSFQKQAAYQLFPNVDDDPEVKKIREYGKNMPGLHQSIIVDIMRNATSKVFGKTLHKVVPATHINKPGGMINFKFVDGLIPV